MRLPRSTVATLVSDKRRPPTTLDWSIDGETRSTRSYLSGATAVRRQTSRAVLAATTTRVSPRSRTAAASKGLSTNSSSTTAWGGRAKVTRGLFLFLLPPRGRGASLRCATRVVVGSRKDQISTKSPVRAAAASRGAGDVRGWKSPITRGPPPQSDLDASHSSRRRESSFVARYTSTAAFFTRKRISEKGSHRRSTSSFAP
mmetsp:Transcript_36583/g.117326  ORF Transcript_36583/g.117326 Transcript_36583/m.117326 type:complete len:201 (-) Transcript_36583:1103-1705(-)